MKKSISLLWDIVNPAFFYPILFSLFPILALYNFNIEYVHYTAILRSVNITLIGVILVLTIANILLRDRAKAAVVVTFFVFLFFIYGHIFTFIDQRWPDVLQNRYLTGIWLIILLVMGGWIIKGFSRIEDANKFLGVVSLTLIALALFNSITFEINKMRSNLENLDRITSQVDEHLSISLDVLPDIYYIILDAHTRSDVLMDHFGFDNSDFIHALEGLGFFVADCSQTNYWLTEYSLTSSLNLDYLQNFLEDPNVLPDWKYSIVRRKLDQLGYTSVSFESRATHNIDLDVDLLLTRRSKADIYEDIYPFTNLNDFEVMLIKTTWLQSWLQLLSNFQGDLPENMILDAENAAYLEHYRQTLYILDELQRVPYLESPKFVMAHLLVPHEPFIFLPNGKYEYHPTDSEFALGYRNNAQFIDSHIGDVLAKIIERSQVPPIIILQGDHGPNGTAPNMLLPILNAYYLPGTDQKNLYPEISPVNSFRVVFNAYFGSDYEILEDTSFYTQGKELKDYEIFPAACP